MKISLFSSNTSFTTVVAKFAVVAPAAMVAVPSAKV